MKLTQPEIRGWTTKDSAELYQIRAWGAGYFGINKDGHVVVKAEGFKNGDANNAVETEMGRNIDLHSLIQDLRGRGYKPPFLLRFSDILRDRVQALGRCFHDTIRDYGYKGQYRGVYPIKVNQQRRVVEELIHYGQPYAVGLEAGSKPELLVALALVDNPNALIICNGYKDLEYIETALLARKLGRNTIIVIDRFDELEMVVEASRRLNVRCSVGIRARLSTKGAGKWVESTGDRSKFGLTASEMVDVVERLRAVDMLDCLNLLHFHIGSQITAIRAIKDALRESCRTFVELKKLGAGVNILDVGGGLGVDYDGSQTNFHSSTNYSMKEYANDVVAAIQEACDAEGLEHPDIVSESGRAMVAHHSVLVFNVLGVNQVMHKDPPVPCKEDEEEVVQKFYEVWDSVSRKNFIEAYHDALALKEEANTLYNLGYLDLRGRARTERIFWSICDKLLKIIKDLEYVPEDLEGLPRRLCDTYYCNFSVFQSVPDHWAVKQLFPTMPIHRLKERPNRRGVLADLTCDSDGKVDQFIDLRDVKETLELHAFEPSKPYYIGMFLVGAYQEILGDLHNLFGDTTAIHISLDRDHGYRIEALVEGDSVTDVLSYVQYDKRDLLARLRRATEQSLRQGKIALDESALLRRHFEKGLDSYTYLDG